jgi:hypothetical protein
MTLPNERGMIPSYMGGLGNQIFIVAAAYVASKIHNCPLYIPLNPLSNNKHNRHKNDYTKTVFKYFGQHIPEDVSSLINTALQQGYFYHAPSNGFAVWNPTLTTPGTVFHSYYQYYPALEFFEEELRELLLKGIEEQRKEMSAMYDTSNAAFLHIRRGDYLNHPDIHYLQSMDYYKNALTLLANSPNPPSKIYVLSDDIDWVNQEELFKSDFCGIPFSVVNIPNELSSFAFMTCCKAGAICANSTFSWWGAFLGAYSDRNLVVVPQRWISDEIVSLFPKEWIII